MNRHPKLGKDVRACSPLHGKIDGVISPALGLQIFKLLHEGVWID